VTEAEQAANKMFVEKKQKEIKATRTTRGRRLSALVDLAIEAEIM